jgi:uncharacterized protein YciI
MHYILFYDVVDGFIEKRAQYRSLHLDQVRKAHERGELVLGGALAEPVDGAVLVFNGSSREAAENFARNDPYVTHGLVTRWWIRKWMTVIGEGATPPQ